MYIYFIVFQKRKESLSEAAAYLVIVLEVLFVAISIQSRFELNSQFSLCGAWRKYAKRAAAGHIKRGDGAAVDF